MVALRLLLRGRRLRLRAPRRRPVRPHTLPYRLITTDAALIARPEQLWLTHTPVLRCALRPANRLTTSPLWTVRPARSLPLLTLRPAHPSLPLSALPQQKAHLAAPHTRLAALIAHPVQLWLTHTLVLRCGSSPCCSGCGAGRPGWPRYAAAPLPLASTLLPRR